MSVWTSKVYLDVSALGRPFDSQNQLRVQMETDAVQLMLAHVATGRIALAMSAPLWTEISANSDAQARDQILAILTDYGVFLDDRAGGVQELLPSLTAAGVEGFDALHVATALAHSFDFVSCDDRLLKRLERQRFAVWCGNPVQFCEREELR